MMPVVSPTLAWEDALIEAGASVVIGVDEVGRGAIAGPVAVGAIAITPRIPDAPPGIRDSKLLSEARRESLHDPICAWAPVHAVGFVAATSIDADGIIPCLAAAAAAAITALGLTDGVLGSAVVLLDGSVDYLSGRAGLDLDVRTRIKADRDCLSVAAASVVAKVERDRYMRSVAERYPGYGFERHKGYGSAAHRAAIAALGPCPEHRHSWLHDDPRGRGLRG